MEDAKRRRKTERQPVMFKAQVTIYPYELPRRNCPDKRFTAGVIINNSRSSALALRNYCKLFLL